MRIQRFLALAGVASRRKADALVANGRVRLNGKPAAVGSVVDPDHDVVEVNGEVVHVETLVYFLMHKPPQTICAVSDPEGRETVLDLIRSKDERLFPVGRLDYHTSGVLLLTNDGMLAQSLLHPRNQVRRLYHVKIRGLISDDELDPLRTGVRIDPTAPFGGAASQWHGDESDPRDQDSPRPKQLAKRAVPVRRGPKRAKTVIAKVERLASTGTHTWIEVELFQGMNKQIHRMFEAIGRTVLKLIRVEFAGLRVDDLRPAQYRPLSSVEIERLRKQSHPPQ